MKFAFTYTTLKLRELLRSGIYRGFMGFMLLLAISAALLLPRVDSHSAYTLAVLNTHQTRLGEAVIATLEQDGGYRIRVCADRRELERAVLSGEAFCGYDFAEDADQRVEKGRYTDLVDSFYQKESPAAALCNEAVCGAVYAYIAPWVARQALVQNGFTQSPTTPLPSPEARRMTITLLGADGQAMEVGNARVIIHFIYSILCSLTGIFAIITAFYTSSINEQLVFTGQKRAVVELCSFLSYSVSYLIILAATHLVLGVFLPSLLTDSRPVVGILATALVGGGLQLLSRRFLTPRVLPLLPFAAVLLVAVANL